MSVLNADEKAETVCECNQVSRFKRKIFQNSYNKYVELKLMCLMHSNAKHRNLIWSRKRLIPGTKLEKWAAHAPKTQTP